MILKLKKINIVRAYQNNYCQSNYDPKDNTDDDLNEKKKTSTSGGGGATDTDGPRTKIVNGTTISVPNKDGTCPQCQSCDRIKKPNLDKDHRLKEDIVHDSIINRVFTK